MHLETTTEIQQDPLQTRQLKRKKNYIYIYFTDFVTLACDLKFLFAAENDSLKHLMWRNVRLKVARIPQLANEFTKTLDEDNVVISGRALNANVIVFPEKIVSQWDHM